MHIHPVAGLLTQKDQLLGVRNTTRCQAHKVEPPRHQCSVLVASIPHGRVLAPALHALLEETDVPARNVVDLDLCGNRPTTNAVPQSDGSIFKSYAWRVESCPPCEVGNGNSHGMCQHLHVFRLHDEQAVPVRGSFFDVQVFELHRSRRRKSRSGARCVWSLLCPSALNVHASHARDRFDGQPPGQNDSRA